MLVNLARGNDIGRKLDARFGLSFRPERPLLCSVVEGEMLGLAASWGWGKAKVSALQGLFAQLVQFSAGHPAVVTAYAE